MSKAIAPKEHPPVPEGMYGWRRSARQGRMFHLHTMGIIACNSRTLDRNSSKEPRDLSDLQYWGVCPRCYGKAKA